MRNLINRILNVFKNKNRKEFHFRDVHRSCKSASKELGDYCKIDVQKSR